MKRSDDEGEEESVEGKNQEEKIRRPLTFFSARGCFHTFRTLDWEIIAQGSLMVVDRRRSNVSWL